MKKVVWGIVIFSFMACQGGDGWGASGGTGEMNKGFYHDALVSGRLASIGLWLTTWGKSREEKEKIIEERRMLRERKQAEKMLRKTKKESQRKARELEAEMRKRIKNAEAQAKRMEKQGKGQVGKEDPLSQEEKQKQPGVEINAGKEEQ